MPDAPKVLPRSIWQQDSEAPECMNCHTPFDGHTTTSSSNRGQRAIARASSLLKATVKSGNRCAISSRRTLLYIATHRHARRAVVSF